MASKVSFLNRELSSSGLLEVVVVRRTSKPNVALVVLEESKSELMRRYQSNFNNDIVVVNCR